MAFLELVYTGSKRNHKAVILQLNRNFRANYFSNFAPTQSRESFFFVWLNVLVRFGFSLCFALWARESLVAQQVIAFPCSAEETQWVDHFTRLSMAKHLCKCVGLSKCHLSGQVSWISRLRVWGQVDFKCKGKNI